MRHHEIQRFRGDHVRIRGGADSLRRAGLVAGSGAALRFADDWVDMLRPDYRTLLREALGEHLLPPNRLCYAVCLSQKPDQLSQWRTYGDDGRGVALGFELSDFTKSPPSFTIVDDGDHPLESHMMTMYRPIIYGHGRSAAYFDMLAARIAHDVHGLRDAGDGGCDAIRARLLDATLEFIVSTAFCKKRFFREEREWRLAVWGPSANIEWFGQLQDALAAALPQRFAGSSPMRGSSCCRAPTAWCRRSTWASTCGGRCGTSSSDRAARRAFRTSGCCSHPPASQASTSHIRGARIGEGGTVPPTSRNLRRFVCAEP